MSEAKISDKGNAIIGIAYSIGFTIGPLVGILLVRKNNVVYDSFMVAALLNFISLLVCMFFEEKRNETTNNQNEDNDGHPTQSRNQRDYFLVALLFQFFYSGFESTLTFSAKERLNFNSREQGMLLIWIGVASIIIHGVFMRRKKQFDDNTVVNIGIIGALCSAILFPFAKTTNQAYVTVLGSSIATSFVNGGLSRLVVIKADSKFKGEQIGKMRKYSQLGRALGPFCASFICSSFGYHSYGFFSSTGLVVTALFLNHNLIIKYE
ncbi:Major facilitator superfamily, general substrate transporter domain-containing protein [Rozella allomycis CSF55]|uniref:Major facilitator superfamily, general substrate transporter domain-containing protein n=1 Tax=Rozella allomycis (strain CSF55) TaxID=988480 RepID=A0A075ASD9_ROZAC|nr:Major facilitator superfamily, general substrate transporter domain-containing protein [Rozella allomycis CSF55]|eukprot:EPZ31611.1 Major facilitator superfamily, general substrate transporter domain-containing protein [Rozella allomycis CSF55]